MSPDSLSPPRSLVHSGGSPQPPTSCGCLFPFFLLALGLQSCSLPILIMFPPFPPCLLSIYPAGEVCALFTCRPCVRRCDESSRDRCTLCLELLILPLHKPGLSPLGRRPPPRPVERVRQNLPAGRTLWPPISVWTTASHSSAQLETCVIS